MESGSPHIFLWAFNRRSPRSESPWGALGLSNGKPKRASEEAPKALLKDASKGALEGRPLRPIVPGRREETLPEALHILLHLRITRTDVEQHTLCGILLG